MLLVPRPMCVALFFVMATCPKKPKPPAEPGMDVYMLITIFSISKFCLSGPDACCGEGCARCVWDVYDDKLERFEQRMEAYQVSHIYIDK